MLATARTRWLHFAIPLLVLVGCSSDEPTSTDTGLTTAASAEASTDTGLTSTTTAGDSGTTDGTTTTATTTAGTTTSGTTGPIVCVETTCQGKLYECGNCLDDDNSGTIDSGDPDCLGPCDNNEGGWKGNIPGQNTGCKLDCYWDVNSGSGNDDCHWDHACDMLSPQDPDCPYDPDTKVGVEEASCQGALMSQSVQCGEVCSPITPNGCDCFGCCEVTVNNAIVTVFVGSTNGDGDGTCSSETIADPSMCRPCTQVPSCANDCVTEDCEVCFGGELPEGCTTPGCPGDIDPCLENQDCGPEAFCLTGCCLPIAP